MILRLNKDYAEVRLPFLELERLFPEVSYSLFFWKEADDILVAFRGTNPRQVLLPSLGRAKSRAGNFSLVLSLSYFWVDRIVRSYGKHRRQNLEKFLREFCEGWGVYYYGPHSARIRILNQSWASELLAWQFGDLELPFPLGGKNSKLATLICKAFPQTVGGHQLHQSG